MRRSRMVVTVAVLAMVASPAVASAETATSTAPVATVAGGLDGPRQLNTYKDGKLVVAEGDSGEVSSVDPRTGTVKTLLTGLPNVQGVDYEDGLLFVALGENPPDAPPSTITPAPGVKGSSVAVFRSDGKLVRSYDLMAYELKHNPDRQRQFGDDGAPLDALSNPFAVHVQGNRILVADAGANDVLSIDRRTNKISTFFVPSRVPVSEVPECEGANDPQGVQGCDPVPTGVTIGKDGLIYVSTLGAEAPKASRVYVLTQHGKVVRVIRGFTGVTGLAVDGWGSVYASELFEGAPEGEPGPDFDPSTVGQIVKVTKKGVRTYAQVTMPTGLEFLNGTLYASAWSVASFLGFPAGSGEVDRVAPGAFHRAG